MSAQSTVRVIPAYPKGYTSRPRIEAVTRPVEAAKIKALGTYLDALKRTALSALSVTLLSAMTGIFAVSGLILFLRTNASFLHPYLAIFLAFGSAALFAVAVISILSVKKRIESVIRRALRTSYEPF